MAYKFNPFTGVLDIVDSGGGGGTPGGATGQLQWNSSGSFAGVGGSTVGATGDITLSLNGAASTPPLKLTGTWFSGGTSTTTKPQFLIEPNGTTSTAWSTSGTGLGVNAPSGFTGNLLDLQVDGTSQLKFSAGSTGKLNVRGSLEAGWINCGNQTIFQFYGTGFGTQPVRVVANGGLSLGNAADTTLIRDAAGTLAQRNGTNAQTYRLYNTYTDASNYQRTSITDDSTGLVIDQQYAGTGAARTNLLDLKDNGTSAFVVTINAGIGIGGPPTSSYNLYNPSNTFLNFRRGTTEDAQLTGNDFTIRSGSVFAWSSTTQASGAADIALKRDQAGVVAITDGSTGTGYLKQTPVAVSALPAAATVGAGTRGFVSDSTVAASGNFGATVAGGGSNNVPVFSDGTNWLIG